MTFSEENFQKQETQLNDLHDELSRLNAQFDAQMKTLNLRPADLAMDESTLAPEMKAMLATAMESAKRAGSARAAQTAPTTQPTGHAPGSGRSGVIRL